MAHSYRVSEIVERIDISDAGVDLGCKIVELDTHTVTVDTIYIDGIQRETLGYDQIAPVADIKQRRMIEFDLFRLESISKSNARLAEHPEESEKFVKGLHDLSIAIDVLRNLDDESWWQRNGNLPRPDLLGWAVRGENPNVR